MLPSPEYAGQPELNSSGGDSPTTEELFDLQRLPFDPGVRAYWVHCTRRRHMEAGRAVVCALHFPQRVGSLHPLAVPLLSLPRPKLNAKWLGALERLKVTAAERDVIQLLADLRSFPALYGPPHEAKYRVALQKIQAKVHNVCEKRIENAFIWYTRQWARILSPYIQLRYTALGEHRVREATPKWFRNMDREYRLLQRAVESYFFFSHEATIVALQLAVKEDRLEYLADSSKVSVEDLKQLWEELMELTRLKLRWCALASDRVAVPPLAALPPALDPLRRE
ncbi:hypothetical protein ACJJTC_003766, partial [Scirpophaga incertulas]